ncbi:hypothetical protein DFH27DRAFT_572062 [Peziza echinospora]|nr:hypothetical protein DFH27DRAFT_572062 [Peziza echinospora]
MKLLSTFVAVAIAASCAAAKEVAPLTGEAAARYRSGEVHMELMDSKIRTHNRFRAAGAYASQQYPPITRYTPCRNGKAVTGKGTANETFACSNVDLGYFLSHADLGSATGEGSSLWGWTAPNGREFGIVGQADGAAFVEVLKDGSLEYLGRLPQQSVTSIWREIRVYKHYAIIGSEALGHGVQIFDLRKLLDIKTKSRWNPKGAPKTFSTTTDLTGLFNALPVGRVHNIVVNEEVGYAVAVGAQPRNSSCAAGLIFIDLKDPSKPTTPGCASQDGYVHDAQCLIYRGPDKRYTGKDICYGYNEDTLTIYDVTNKKNTTVISRTSYEGASYTHQGWVLDKDWQEYLITDDELDEMDGAGPGKDGFPVSFIWDIKDLQNPKQTGLYKSKTKSIDHNQYVIDDWVYQSNYGAGLRILDLSSVKKDPTGKGIKEVGFFDIYPEDDAVGGVVDFVGTWASYGFFESGWILINTIERGLFSVKYNNPQKPGRGGKGKGGGGW